MPQPRIRLIAGLAFAAVLGATAVFFATRSAPMPLGIAPEITGRLATIDVHAGQVVHKGELLAVLDNPELAASLGEAKAAAASAKAVRANVYAGLRAEQVATLFRSVETAEANLVLAEQEQVRATALAARDFASKQKLDESEASLAKAKADLDLKRAELAAGRAGPTAEVRALAESRVALAEATVATLQAELDKTRLVAPVDSPWMSAPSAGSLSPCARMRWATSPSAATSP